MRYLPSAPLIEANYIGEFHQNAEFLKELAGAFSDACLWDNERHLFKVLDTVFYIRPTVDNEFVLAIEQGLDKYVECVVYTLDEVHDFLLGGSLEYKGLAA